MKKIILCVAIAINLTGCEKSNDGNVSYLDSNQVKQHDKTTQAIDEKPETTGFESGKTKAEFKLDSVETANCAAAAMKSQEVEVFSKWFNVLEEKYALIYPDKNKEGIEAYTTERILDKRRSLESKGFDSKPALNNYYQMNCIKFEPK